MKASHTLLFILSVFLLLGIAWFVFPAEGVSIGDLDLHFPSYAEARTEKQEAVDVDAVLKDVSKSFEMSCSENELDSLEYFRNFLTLNPNRIYLPDDDYTYFDSLFFLLEHARENQKTYRIMHYGDSQIEMDRISSVLRQKLQERFGGSGPNMIPAVQRIASISVSQSYSGGLTRYTIYGDSTTRRAPHNRYGVMTQFSQCTGQANISFYKSRHSQAFDKVKEITKVSILFGNNSDNFKASLKTDLTPQETKECPACSGVSLLSWDLPEHVNKGTITLQGKAEIYAILLDGDYGVAIDNNPLRGCSGTIFNRINAKVMEESFDLLDTRLIILQFGGNRMPGIAGSKSIGSYMKELDKQIEYLKMVAPNAALLFIGPADMGKSYNGKIGTWKGLPELNDSLRATSLRNDIAYWDMFHVMGGEGSMAQFVKHKPALAGPDYIHFTFTGAQEIGNDLAQTLLVYHDFYQFRKRLPKASVMEFMKKKTRFKPINYYQE